MALRDRTLTIQGDCAPLGATDDRTRDLERGAEARLPRDDELARHRDLGLDELLKGVEAEITMPRDRKSTRLNSSHEWISYAVFCLKKKKRKQRTRQTEKTY